MNYSFETYKILLVPSVIVGFGYCFYFIQGQFNTRVSKQLYNKLREKDFFLRQLILTFGLGVIGYYIQQMMLFMPFSFLIIFWIMNKLSELFNGKPIIFGTRWNAPKKKRRSSGFNTFIILMLTFIFSIIIALITGIATVSSEPPITN